MILTTISHKNLVFDQMKYLDSNKFVVMGSYYPLVSLLKWLCNVAIKSGVTEDTVSSKYILVFIKYTRTYVQKRKYYLDLKNVFVKLNLYY